MSNMNCNTERGAAPAPDSMGRLQRFCGALSHDLNNYVGAILGYAELMKLELHDANELLNYLNSLEQTCHKFRNLSSMLENLAENQKIVCCPCNVSALLLRALPSLATGIPIQWELTPDVTAYCEPALLEKSIAHILENAREAGEPGSSIILKVNRMDGANSQGAGAMIEICDHGTGMTEDVAQQVFDPYFTTKGKGRGRGMTWARGWIGRMGGHIEINPNYPQGTRVAILLPPVPKEDEV